MGFPSRTLLSKAWSACKLLATGELDTFRRRLRHSLRRTMDYNKWYNLRMPVAGELRCAMARLPRHPRLSIIMAVNDAVPEFLRKTITSVQNQYYSNWELCITGTCSNIAVLTDLRRLAKKDARITLIGDTSPRSTAVALNAALDLVSGEYLGLLNEHDELAPAALFRIAQLVTADPETEMIYTDEDRIDRKGNHSAPFFKPDWSPEYMLAWMYTSHLSIYRTDVVRAVGGFDSDFDGAADYHLALRIVARRPRIHHIPEVLYHSRSIPQPTVSTTKAIARSDSARKALMSFLLETGQSGRVESGPTLTCHRVRYDIIGTPRVSIVIPTAAKPVCGAAQGLTFVEQCVRSIRCRSSYRQFEIVVIHNCDMSAELQYKLEAQGVRLLGYQGAGDFNLARKINYGVRLALGEYLILLNDDTEVKTGDWIESMLEFCQQPEIGAVGCKLLFPDETIQHSGVVISSGPGHPYHRAPGNTPGYYWTNSVHRNFSAVTGACIMTKAELFRIVGGFSEEFPINYNDVDYCLKLRKRGQRIVYTPYAVLYHHEGMSRKLCVEPWEMDLFQKRWPEYLGKDPHYNYHLSQTEYFCEINCHGLGSVRINLEQGQAA